MSKKQQQQHDYYYSSTSFPSGSSREFPPSAPDANDISKPIPPPSYDAATHASSGVTDTAPFSSSPLQGFVRDATFLASEPSTPFDAGDYLGPEVVDEASQPLLANQEDHSFQGRPAPPSYSVYKAPFETSTEGILSRDDHINHDGEALLQFLYQHNKPPRMKVKFHGYHEETQWKPRTTRNNEGKLVTELEPITTQVDDFLFDIDCSHDISPACQGVYVMADPSTGESKTVRQLCDDYVHEKNQLKELQMTKVVLWDYPQLTRAFTAAIREQGYLHTVKITYEKEDDKVTVKTDTPLARWIDNRVIRFIFFISCLWIIAWPVVWLFKKKFGHSTLKSEWVMAVSERDWYQRHVHQVVGQLRNIPSTGPVPFLL
ncbi:uncharacterized protein BYT42DRAFT_56977 [Radiomyces spectabilis]|uniref:uncharacterized protein n=1 Tax=Radiomyces spectabilis TaxID=64574 RepID=UPI00221FFDE9|nr:uncharacterized protein BYT42DRAFT_56977 [Radiomyces spectabilis]KAI8373063.1 hypothetical protein BYT42DRAFT_56977 [Radiomyces spectabilis]